MSSGTQKINKLNEIWVGTFNIILCCLRHKICANLMTRLLLHKYRITYIQQIPTSDISIIEYIPKIHISIEIIIFKKNIRRQCIFTAAKLDFYLILRSSRLCLYGGDLCLSGTTDKDIIDDRSQNMNDNQEQILLSI